MKGHQWNSQTSRILPHPQFWNSWIRHWCYIIDNSPSFSECYDWQQTTYLKIKLTYLRAFNARFCLTTHLKIKMTYLRAFNARFCLTTNLKIKLTYLRAFNARFCFIPCWRATSHAAHRQETLKERILNPSPSIQPGCPLSHIFSWYCHPRSFPFIFNVLPHISVILNLSKVISKEIYHFFFTAFECNKFQMQSSSLEPHCWFRLTTSYLSK